MIHPKKILEMVEQSPTAKDRMKAGVAEANKHDNITTAQIIKIGFLLGYSDAVNALPEAQE